MNKEFAVKIYDNCMKYFQINFAIFNLITELEIIQTKENDKELFLNMIVIAISNFDKILNEEEILSYLRINFKEDKIEKKVNTIFPFIYEVSKILQNNINSVKSTKNVIYIQKQIYDALISSILILNDIIKVFEYNFKKLEKELEEKLQKNEKKMEENLKKKEKEMKTNLQKEMEENFKKKEQELKEILQKKEEEIKEKYRKRLADDLVENEENEKKWTRKINDLKKVKEYALNNVNSLNIKLKKLKEEKIIKENILNDVIKKNSEQIKIINQLNYNLNATKKELKKANEKISKLTNEGVDDITREDMKSVEIEMKLKETFNNYLQEIKSKMENYEKDKKKSDKEFQDFKIKVKEEKENLERKILFLVNEVENLKQLKNK